MYAIIVKPDNAAVSMSPMYSRIRSTWLRPDANCAVRRRDDVPVAATRARTRWR